MGHFAYWTVRLLFGHFAYWTLHLLVILPTRHFAYRTFRLLDSLFTIWTVRLLITSITENFNVLVNLEKKGLYSRDVVSVLNVSVSRRFLERLGLISVSRVWKNRTSRSCLGLEGSTSRSRLGLEDITSRSWSRRYVTLVL